MTYTANQREVLDALKDREWATAKDLALALGRAKTSSVAMTLVGLERRGGVAKHRRADGVRWRVAQLDFLAQIGPPALSTPAVGGGWLGQAARAAVAAFRRGGGYADRA